MVNNQSIQRRMKRIYTFGWLIGGLMLLAGCDDSNRDDNLSEPLIYFINSGEVTENIYLTGEDAVCNLPIFKSGLIEKSANMELAVNEQLIELYNQTNKTQAQVLPAKYYRIPDKDQTMEADQKKSAFQVVFKTSELDEDPNRDNYILPLELINRGEVQINPDKSSVFIFPSVHKATVGFTTGKQLKQTIESESTGELEIALPIATSFKNKWDIDFTAVIDPEALAGWNEENGTSHPLMDESHYKLVGEHKIPANSDVQTLKLTVNQDLLPNGWSVLPIRLSNPSKFEWGDEQDLCFVIIYKRTEVIPHNLWTFVSSSSNQGSETGDKMIDDNEATQWHSKWSGITLPQNVVFKLAKVYEMNEFTIMRRTDQYNTDLKAGDIEVSMDGTNWTLATKFNFGVATSTGHVSFYSQPVKGRYIRVLIKESNRTTNVSIVEFNAYGELVK